MNFARRQFGVVFFFVWRHCRSVIARGSFLFVIGTNPFLIDFLRYSATSNSIPLDLGDFVGVRGEKHDRCVDLFLAHDSSSFVMFTSGKCKTSSAQLYQRAHAVLPESDRAPYAPTVQARLAIITRKPAWVRTGSKIPRLNSSSSTARIVASLESFIDNFDPDQILCQAVDPFLNFLAIISFGRLLQADTDFSDFVESVTRATAF